MIQNHFTARFTFFPEAKSILIAGLEALRKGHQTAVAEGTGTAGHGSETPILTLSRNQDRMENSQVNTATLQRILCGVKGSGTPEREHRRWRNGVWFVGQLCRVQPAQLWGILSLRHCRNALGMQQDPCQAARAREGSPGLSCHNQGGHSRAGHTA